MWRLQQFLRRLIRRARDRNERINQQRRNRAWTRLAAKLPRSEDGKTMLHIGCGDINAAGYINIDARPQPHVHIVTTTLFKLAMIPPDIADLIYMSHVLEHVCHRDVVATLREMHRILKPKGILRVSVPDFEKIIEIYQSNGNELTPIEQALMGGQDYTFNFHYAVFNDAHLRKKFIASGFREARAWNPETCQNHDFEDWASRHIEYQGRHFAISLNIEAIK